MATPEALADLAARLVAFEAQITAQMGAFTERIARGEQRIAALILELAQEKSGRETLIGQLRTEVEREAKLLYKHFSTDPLFVAGVTLYQAHGDQNAAHTVRFSTAEALSHQVFIRFLERYAGIEKRQVHIWLLLSAQHDEERLKRYWER